jgi:hypothetical protein
MPPGHRALMRQAADPQVVPGNHLNPVITEKYQEMLFGLKHKKYQLLLSKHFRF